MDCTKVLVVLIVVALATSSVAIIESVSAQTLKPVVTDFWLQYIDNSYDVPPSTKSTKDIYTGEVTSSTVSGYRVENTSIVVTIKNPPDVDAYNFRWKDHNNDIWHYEPFDPDHPLPLHAYDCVGIRADASSSDYTILSLIFIPKTLTSADIQVQALYGDYQATPYGLAPSGPTYDFYFDGQASYWSHTQSIDVNNAIVHGTATLAPTATSTEHPTAAPTQATAERDFAFTLNWELVALAAACAVIAVLAVSIFLLWRRLPRHAT